MREELAGKYSLSVKVGNLRHFEMRLIAYKWRKYTLLAIDAKYAMRRICLNLSQYDRVKQIPIGCNFVESI